MITRKHAIVPALLAGFLALTPALGNERPTTEGWDYITAHLDPAGSVYLYLDAETVISDSLTSITGLLEYMMIRWPDPHLAGTDFDAILREFFGKLGFLAI